ncbi:MAG: HEAT repeat domain-containing protein [Xenococcaceae cyanobacterium]
MTDCTQELIQAVEQADSADGLLEAVEALAAVRQEAAIPILIKILGYNNPGAAVAAVEGLVELGEPAVPYLLEEIDGYNYGARAWAIRAFAGIGDPRALELLLDAASSDFSLSVRRAAAKGLGSIRWSKLPAEEVTAAQTQVLKTLLLVSQDGEWVVRYAAVVGLQALASAVAETQPDFVLQILERFNRMAETDSELAVRARVQMALAQLKYILNKSVVMKATDR